MIANQIDIITAEIDSTKAITMIMRIKMNQDIIKEMNINIIWKIKELKENIINKEFINHSIIN